MKNKKFCLIALLIAHVFMSANARNQRDVPRDSDLDAETRRALKEAKMPAGMNPEDWERSLLMYKIMMSENDNFEFHGQVLDHKENPIADAEVMAQITAFDPAYILGDGAWGSETKETELTVKADYKGRFIIKGRGTSLEVTAIRAKGYVAPSSRKTFGVSKKHHNYSGDVFSRRHPAVFTVWPEEMMAEKKNLKKIYYRDQFVADGSVRRMDLVTGAVTNNNSLGDIVYSLKSDAKPNMPGGTRYDWMFKISSTSGGVIETSKENQFLAPTNGYQSEINKEFKASNAGWESGYHQEIFVVSNNGSTYGFFLLHVSAFFDGDALVSVRGVINTNGSPNLFLPEGY